MTNGSAALNKAMLERAGLAELIRPVLDVEGPKAWKPAAAAYHYAVNQLGLQPHEVLPWWQMTSCFTEPTGMVWPLRGCPTSIRHCVHLCDSTAHDLSGPTLFASNRLHAALNPDTCMSHVFR